MVLDVISWSHKGDKLGPLNPSSASWIRNLLSYYSKQLYTSINHDMQENKATFFRLYCQYLDG